MEEGSVIIMPEEVNEKLNNIIERQGRMDEQIKTLFRSIESMSGLTETVQKLAMSVERLALSLKGTEEKVSGIKTDLDEIKTKPAKRWDMVVTTALTIIITAGITYFLTKAGIK